MRLCRMPVYLLALLIWGRLSFNPVEPFSVQRRGMHRRGRALNVLPPLGRRKFLASSAAAATTNVLISTALLLPQVSVAEITDETENWWMANDKAPVVAASESTAVQLPSMTPQSSREVSDEVTVRFTKRDLQQLGGLGLELADVEFRTNRRVYVKSIRPGSLGARLGVQKDWVVVSLNQQSTERTNAQGVAQMLQTALNEASSDNNVITLAFRDPAAFRSQLNNLASADSGSVTTQVAPAGDTTQRYADGSVRLGEANRSQEDQKITVSQLIPPKLCKRGATTDDLLEISYLGTVVETGQVFDGSAIKINGQAIAGRGDDVTIFFVLGKQPFGQFPPGWDVGLEGMCVGERRRLIVPPVLGYGSKGVPRRGIPPNSTLQYDVTLISINGLATPQ